MGNLTMLGASDWELDAGAQTVADAAAGPSAFSWRRPKTQPTMTLASISEDLLQDHIFIGILTMRHRPYSEMTESIDVLSEMLNAGAPNCSFWQPARPVVRLELLHKSTRFAATAAQHPAHTARIRNFETITHQPQCQLLARLSP
jgi:hypothetical protein